MSTEAPPRTALSDQDLRKLLGLMKASDSVELKLTVPEEDHRSAIAALGLDPLDAQVRQVYFLDTPDLRVSSSGVVVRARRVQGKTGDTVVKLRPVDPAALPKDLRRLPNFNVEVDAMPGGFVCSASLKGIADNQRIKDAVGGRAPVAGLFSKEQRAFYAEHAPSGIPLDSLEVLGPIFVLRVKWAPGNGLPRMVGELWMYPDGSRVMELSTKCHPDEGMQVATEARAFLSERGVNLFGEQETKTRKALEYFAGAQG